MKKIAIYVCGEVAKSCIGTGCLKSYNQLKDSFEQYKDEDTSLVAFNHCNGCNINIEDELELKIEKMKKFEIDVVHISTCIRGRCEHYEKMAEEFGKHFDVIGYTHGSSEGKLDNSISIIDGVRL